MSDHTLRQYENESMGTELACLKLGYLVQAAVLDTPIEDYEHAFFVKPESPTGARAPLQAGLSQAYASVRLAFVHTHSTSATLNLNTQHYPSARDDAAASSSAARAAHSIKPSSVTVL